MFAFKKKPAQSAFTAQAPAGERVYAIGDVHGRADLLARLLDKIMAEDAPAKRVIFLGDFVDRGAGSASVLDILLNLRDAFTHTVFLKGNHEEAMLDFIADPIGLETWIDWGGAETLESYGLAGVYGRSPETLRDELVERLPDTHFHFLMNLPAWHRAGDYVFVHAGLRPGIALEQQRTQDMLWIREEFYASGAEDWGDMCIVHGHTPQNTPENLSWRINVDTGAFRSGTLTAVVLEGAERRFLTS